MGKTPRHIQEAFVGRRQLEPGPASEGRAGLADIDHHVINPTSGHPHQLVLGHGAALVMQATQDALGRLAVIVLHPRNLDAQGCEVAGAVGLVEESPVVAEYLRFQVEQTGQRLGKEGQWHVLPMAGLPEQIP